MRRRMTFAIPAVLFLAVLAAPVRAETSPPILVVRVKSLENLIADGKYLAGLSGQDEKSTDIEGVIDSVFGKEIKGIDPKRPLLLYSSVEDGNYALTAVLPVTGEQDFLDWLKHFNLKTVKGGDGIYSVTPDEFPITVYFRFANQSVYATVMDRSFLEKDKLLDPAKLTASAGTATLSASFHLDQVPGVYKQIALQTIDQESLKAQAEPEPGETKSQHEIKVQGAQEMARELASLIKEGGTLEVQLNVDRQAQELTADLSLSGKPQSKLALSIADLGRSTGQVAGVGGANSALNLVAHGPLPAAVRASVQTVIDENTHQALDKEKDETKRQQAEKFLQALEPTLKAEDLDTALSLRGPGEDKHYTLVAGIRLKNGAAVDKEVRDLVKSLGEGDRKKIHLDAESAGEVKIHQVDVQDQFEKMGQQFLGDHPLYVAVNGDLLLVAGGPDGLSALKEALTAQPKGAGPQLQVDLSLARLAPLMTPPDSAVKAAKDAFKAGQDGDTIHLSVQGGDSLKVHLAVKAPVVKFFGDLLQAQQAAVEK